MCMLIQLAGRQLTSNPVTELERLVGASGVRPSNPWLLRMNSLDAIAVLLVPKGGGAISLNGIPLQRAAYVVQHADRIDVDGKTFWVAASSDIEIAHYDPAVHGDDIFCFVTKARLQPDEEIVLCPGCGIICRRAAWDMVLEADPKFRCPGCRFDPFAGDWVPTLPRVSSIDRIMELARRDADLVSPITNVVGGQGRG